MNAPLTNIPLMNMPRVEPFYLEAEPGRRFCLYHAPAVNCRPRGGILYIHPFAEEMNKTRHIAARQSRALAALGYAVLQIDLYGCGDSCGDFGDARWGIWKQDLVHARAWLSNHSVGPQHLWGLRLGALLALEHACELAVAGLILWQPILRGKICISQFLRLRVAAEMLNEGSAAEASAGLRQQLARQQAIEVGGYLLSAQLCAEIESRDAGALMLPPCRVDWFSCATVGPLRTAAASEQLGQLWQTRDVALRHHLVDCPPFWAGVELAACPDLLAATTAVAAAAA